MISYARSFRHPTTRGHGAALDMSESDRSFTQSLFLRCLAVSPETFGKLLLLPHTSGSISGFCPRAITAAAGTKEVSEGDFRAPETIRVS